MSCAIAPVAEASSREIDKARLCSFMVFLFTAGFIERSSVCNVLSAKTYTILAQDLNWSPGQQNLRDLVSYASSN